jgi:hypothetical protein
MTAEEGSQNMAQKLTASSRDPRVNNQREEDVDMNANILQRSIVAVAVLFLAPALALALALSVLLFAPVSLIALPFIATAFASGAKDAPRCEEPAIERHALQLAPAL